jgi:hypothetical protein
MAGPVPHFRIPLNLPHAGTIASRILYHLGNPEPTQPASKLALRLESLLKPYLLTGENPPQAESERVIREAAQLARLVVGEIERGKTGSDRLGQAIRNLFECLGLGEEGARISLRAGENPRSVLRPI